jgi:polysaccharide biosynthesis transport protein
MPLNLYARAVRGHWGTVLVFVVLGAALLGAYSWHRPDLYRSHTRVLLSYQNQADPGGEAAPADQGLVRLTTRTYTQLATSAAVLREVSLALRLPYSPEQLTSEVVAVTPVGTTFIDITVVDRDPRRAAHICAAIGDRLTAAANRDRLTASPASLVPEVLVIAPPPVPRRPIASWPVAYPVTGALAGFLLGAGLCALRWQLADRGETLTGWLAARFRARFRAARGRAARVRRTRLPGTRLRATRGWIVTSPRRLCAVLRRRRSYGK